MRTIEQLLQEEINEAKSNGNKRLATRLRKAVSELKSRERRAKKIEDAVERIPDEHLRDAYKRYLNKEIPGVIPGFTSHGDLYPPTPALMKEIGRREYNKMVEAGDV